MIVYKKKLRYNIATCTTYTKIERQTSLPSISAGQDALNLSKGETYEFVFDPKPLPLDEDEKAEILIVV